MGQECGGASHCPGGPRSNGQLARQGNYSPNPPSHQGPSSSRSPGQVSCDPQQGSLDVRVAFNPKPYTLLQTLRPITVYPEPRYPNGPCT